MSFVHPEKDDRSRSWWRIAAVGAGAALLLAVVGLFLVLHGYRTEQGSARRALNDEATQAASTASQFVTGEIKTLAAVAGSTEVLDGDLAGMRAAFRRIDPQGAASGGGFAWVDDSGLLRVLDAIGPDQPVPDLSAREYVLEGLKARAPRVGEAVLSAGTTPIITFTVPTYGRSGTLSGLLLRAQALNQENPLLRALSASPDVYLLDRADHILVRGGRPVEGLTTAPDTLRERLKSGKSDDLGDAGFGEGRQVLADAPVPEAGWTVGVQRSEADLYAGARRSALLEAVAVVAVALAVGAGAALGAWRLDRRQRRQRAELDREHETAVRLQQALLSEPDSPHGLAVRWRYRPASKSLEVGGDWYDVINLDDGLVLLAIGDVVGHSLDAAALMGRLRSATRAVAPLVADAAELLAQLDRLVEATDALGSTLALVVVDPSAATVVHCSAGHLPPLRVSADGTSAFLTGGLRPPLGVRPRTEVPCAEHALAAGDLLVLYTDGLVERRDRPIDDRLELLRVEAERAVRESADLDGLLDHLLGAMASDRQRDDIALLAVQLPLGPVPATEAGRLPRSPRCRGSNSLPTALGAAPVRVGRPRHVEAELDPAAAHGREPSVGAVGVFHGVDHPARSPGSFARIRVVVPTPRVRPAEPGHGPLVPAARTVGAFPAGERLERSGVIRGTAGRRGRVPLREIRWCRACDVDGRAVGRSRATTDGPEADREPGRTTPRLRACSPSPRSGLAPLHRRPR